MSQGLLGARLTTIDDTHDMRVALDPGRSVVIDACAGSGKTWLLVSRVVRLLLAGVSPSEILAITFTRKAAQEMRARLSKWLRQLATQSDAEVIEFLRERGIADEDLDRALVRARSLFEISLSAQPPITIETFHGWFLQILERAPFNTGGASVPSGFSLEARVAFLLDEAWDLFGAMLRLPANAALAAGFDELCADLGYATVRRLIARFMQKRAEWWAYTLGQSDAVGFALAELQEILAVEPDGDPLCFTVDESAFVAALKTIAAVPPGKSKAQETFSRNVCDALTEPDAVSRFERLHGAFFTKKHEPLKALQGFFDKQTDDLRGLFAGVIGRLAAARNARTEHAVLRMHARALPCAARLLEIFQQLKRSRQIIDFTDVEWHAFQLLSDGDDASFMHAKLDSRYKHILLDEFQDTNPLQWQVMRAWLDGYGKDAGRPTVFVVGDPKQSIYRFRRAEPRLFEIAAELLATDYGAARLVRNDTRRCAPAIVQVVNATFAGNDEYPDFPLHVSLATAVTGRVEVLALARHPESAPESMAPAWRNPLLAPFREREDLRRNQEAALLAARIREIVGNWEVHDRAGSRPARFSDVMILKRNRTHLAVYEQALRNFDIPFLTSRLGGLLGTLEAADLCALIEVLIAPFDNLKLAHVLRSPLFSCSDDDLVQLARTRANDDDAGHSSWWHRLHAAAELGESASLVRAWRMLSKWQNAADAEPVHDLLDRIYHEGQVLARYHAACPPVIAGQVRANLDRFLELALELDGGRYPSLPRFVAELARLRTAQTRRRQMKVKNRKDKKRLRMNSRNRARTRGKNWMPSAS